MGFLIWVAWKERNWRTFRDEYRQIEEIWKVVLENIRETVLTEKWHEDDWKANGHEDRILAMLNLKPQMLAPASWKQKPLGRHSHDPKIPLGSLESPPDYTIRIQSP